MIWFTQFLLILPFLAFGMVFLLGTLRTLTVCLAVLLIYVVTPFLYMGALSFAEADTTFIQVWQQLLEIQILTPLMRVVSVTGAWIVLSIMAATVVSSLWLQFRRSAA